MGRILNTHCSVVDSSRRLVKCGGCSCRQPSMLCTWQGLTWQQAVQYIEETHVWSGHHVNVTASHDTYGITFQLDQTEDARDDHSRETTGLQCTCMPMKVCRISPIMMVH